jgi:spermidine synthase
MTDDSNDHVQPYLYEDEDSVSLHFELHSIQSRMRRDDPNALVLDYTRTMMGCLLLHPAPQRLLMIGLGGGSLPKYCHHHVPHADITVVEINPHVIALREAFAVPPDSARFRVLLGDGAVLVTQQPALLDLLMVDGFTYEGQPEALCSADFYAACRAALAPDGVLVVNLSAADKHSTVYRDRIAAAFDEALLAVRSDDGGNVVVLAGAPCRELTAARMKQAQARWQAADLAHRRMLAHVGAQLLRVA